MASFKYALAALALFAVVVCFVAVEEANAASLDGGYPKFPNRVRREGGGGAPWSGGLEQVQKEMEKYSQGLPKPPGGYDMSSLQSSMNNYNPIKSK